jgi:hypothetical protein
VEEEGKGGERKKDRDIEGLGLGFTTRSKLGLNFLIENRADNQKPLPALPPLPSGSSGHPSCRPSSPPSPPSSSLLPVRTPWQRSGPQRWRVGLSRRTREDGCGFTSPSSRSGQGWPGSGDRRSRISIHLPVPAVSQGCIVASENQADWWAMVVVYVATFMKTSLLQRLSIYSCCSRGNPEIWFSRSDDDGTVVSFLSWEHRLWSSDGSID